MKTLVPPPIMPGPWRSDPYSFLVLAPPSGRSSDALGKDTKLLEVKIADCESRPCGPSESKANAYFIAAAPAMAEALEECRQYLSTLPESMHKESNVVYLKALSALLSAGYTLADEGKAEGHSSTPDRE